MVTTSDIRERFLSFFAKHGHQIVPSSSLIPGTDKTLLFTNAGMVQFKDVFTGEEVRDYNRAVTTQRCVRAGGKHNDLDNVGYTARHHTFFEMLGNFSFGDYFKEEAIAFAWQFLTEELSLPADKLWVTVFEEDDEAEAIWVEKIGVPKERVIRIGAKDNFWMMGDTGPCGPCSEIFYDHGPDVWGGPPGSAEEDGDRFIEIWNLVFMQFDKDADGNMTPLPKPCVDTGMGLERVSAVMQHVHSNYEIDLLQELVRAASRITGQNDLTNPSLNVIADHIRCCAFLIADGVLPGNDGRGYVLRRIIRRAVRHGNKLGVEGTFFHKLVDKLVALMGDAFPELSAARDHVVEQLLLEEERFAKTLSAGLSILETEIKSLEGSEIPGDVVFKLYDTYGFPMDLTADIARERDLTIDSVGFDTHMDAQRARARAASSFANAGGGLPQSDSQTQFLGYELLQAECKVLELIADGQPVQEVAAGTNAWVVLDKTPFYGESGGQVGDTGQMIAGSCVFEVVDTQKNRKAFLHGGTVSSGSIRVGETVTCTVNDERRGKIQRHHSATHLLHGGLRYVLGDHVEQRGSLVNDEQLRFDFSHTGPVTQEQMEQVEKWMDAEVRANHAATIEEMSMDEAVAAGAMALFGEKYGDRVRVVTLGQNSIELCGGTHVLATGELGTVRVTAETGVASGVRRIEAVSGEAALEYSQATQRELRAVADSLKTSTADVQSKLQQLQARSRDLGREVEQLQSKLSAQAGQDLAADVEEIAGVKTLARVVDSTDVKGLRAIVDQLKQELDSYALMLASEHGGKAILICAVSPDLHAKAKAGDLVKVLAEELGGRGGGRPDMAQGGADSLKGVETAFQTARGWLAAQFG